MGKGSEATVDTRKLHRAKWDSRILYQAIESSHSSIVITDRNGVIEYVNPYFSTLTGYSPAEAIGQTPRILKPPGKPSECYRELWETITAGREWHGEFYNRKKNGEYYWEMSHISPVLDETGQITHFVAVKENITERKAMEEDLKEREELYRSLIQQSSDAIALVDPKNRQILEINQRFSEMFGYSASEAASLSIYDFVVASRQKIDSYYDYLEQSGINKPEIVRYRCRDGDIVAVERTGSIVKYRGKHAFVFNFRNLSQERVQQEKISREVALAGKVQRELLPTDRDEAEVSIRTLYQPYHLVSGDSFDFSWDDSHTILSGYLLDVAGHGISTALQTAALNVLMRDILSRRISLPDKLAALNREAGRYFAEDAFAAVILFEFDFKERQLIYASGGIHDLLVCCRTVQGHIKVPGSLIGVSEDISFQAHTLPFRPGDTFCFISDGLSDLLSDGSLPDLTDFAATLDYLQALAHSPVCRDDASAVCFSIH